MRSHKNAWNSVNRSRSETNIIPPWCSSGKVSRRKLVPKCEIKSSYPLREDIWEYLHKENCAKRKVCKQRMNRKTKLVIIVLLLLLAGFTGFLWNWSVNATPSIQNGIEWIDQLITRAKSSFVTWKPSVSEECCYKMRYLTLELFRAEHNLRNTIRQRRVMQNYPQLNANRYVKGAIVTKGSDTVEWGSRAALWGIVPLWEVSPPADTVLSLRHPTPADCWPFSGSAGELIFQLPNNQRISGISIEHIRPDKAKSAPKYFKIYGNLANNSMVKMMDSQYQQTGPPKQYFAFRSMPAIRRLIIKVLTNQGNVKYTCIYRIHLYGNNGFETSREIDNN